MGLTIKQKRCNQTNYRVGRTADIRYLVMHFTGNDGDTAENNADYFAGNANLSASAHYFVDENEIYQSVLDSDTAWHCGASTYKHPECRNANSIGIEMCSRKDSSGRYYIANKTVANAVLLAKQLMVTYGIKTDHVLRHYDVTGKNCPAPWVVDSGYWTTFLSRISKEERKMKETQKDNAPAAWEKDAVDKAISKGILKGDSNGDLMLHTAVTRAQLMVFLDRLRLLD